MTVKETIISTQPSRKPYPAVDAMWGIDIETTGLDPKTGHIIEVCLSRIVFNKSTQQWEADRAEPIREFLMKCPDTEDGKWRIEDMPQVNGEYMHQDLVRIANEAVDKQRATTPQEMAAKIAERIREYPEKKGVCFFGSSVHFDVSWIKEKCPALMCLVTSHRLLDATALALFCATIMGDSLVRPEDPPSFHRAGQDIDYSLVCLNRAVALVTSPARTLDLIVFGGRA